MTPVSWSEFSSGPSAVSAATPSRLAAALTAVVNGFNYASAFPALTSQNVCCESCLLMIGSLVRGTPPNQSLPLHGVSKHTDSQTLSGSVLQLLTRWLWMKTEWCNKGPQTDSDLHVVSHYGSLLLAADILTMSHAASPSSDLLQISLLLSAHSRELRLLQDV